jgi:hypothetical protein
MLAVIGGVEIAHEVQEPHYMSGGKIGDVPVPFGWNPLGLKAGAVKGGQGDGEDVLKMSLESELKNGCARPTGPSPSTCLTGMTRVS